jgi:hypothetical protein
MAANQTAIVKLICKPYRLQQSGIYFPEMQALPFYFTLKLIACMCTRFLSNVYCFRTGAGQKKEQVKSHPFYNFITDI